MQYYDRARDYDAAIGRFMGRDPLGILSMNVNLTIYVDNDSVNCFDPTGDLADLGLVTIPTGYLLLMAAAALAAGGLGAYALTHPNQPLPVLPDPLAFARQNSGYGLELVAHTLAWQNWLLAKAGGPASPTKAAAEAAKAAAAVAAEQAQQLANEATAREENGEANLAEIEYWQEEANSWLRTQQAWKDYISHYWPRYGPKPPVGTGPNPPGTW